MSKSLGNVVSPKEIIDGGANQKENPGLGADTLRLWVSGVDYTGDVCLGANIMKQVFESSRKLRNTLRYLIGNLNDFDPEKDAVAIDQLPSLDRYILGRLSALIRDVEGAYDEYQFYRVNSAIFQFAVSDLSAFYLDTAKDRLYISSKNDPRRRSCQTVLRHLLEQLTVAMAPVVPHMAEDVWQNLPYPAPCASVFEKGWIPATAMFEPHDEKLWEFVRVLRGDVNKCIELARQAKATGASQEMQVVLHTGDPELAKMLEAIKGDDGLLATPLLTNGVDDLRFVLLVSQVRLVDSEDEVARLCPTYRLSAGDTESKLTVGVLKASSKKCDRCWYYSDTVGQDGDHPEICPRCADVVRNDGYVIAES